MNPTVHDRHGLAPGVLLLPALPLQLHLHLQGNSAVTLCLKQKFDISCVSAKTSNNFYTSVFGHH
jgi:hypothetical protein